ncbi:HD domain-containing phosphohydrolase [Vibrio europaeus]|uniref:HD domain-containing phosphohydrolase n=1 Tax=Vibrio europaeus TaxID=300876 RepID=UPI00148B9937|nr:HD domain-containing phosphohydrolase [Vibrio europaeus]MDC5819183.1 response regulator [Vibrio europaeus]MDC5838610.1 response regulator [Vibrio europaeus]MDC5851794.1 response regulator [Vibrio europaeus]MDC5856373.1 response regulator [Vibrio europaeus]MDC5870795.1 response regulator [Vibrio europaeus]
MNKPVLLVDDEVNILNSFRRTLRSHVDIDLANSGEQALELISKKQYAVIVSDMQMPVMNGLQLLQAVKEKSPDTVRMMFTGNADQQTAVDAVNLGDVFRFINKPCTPEQLLGFINAAIRQYELIVAEKVLLNKTLKGVINVLSDVVSLVSPEINDRSNKVQFHMQQLSKALNLKPHWSFEPMVQLSQLGFIIFPQSTLENISNGQVVTEEDRQLFDQHPCLSSDLLKQIPRMSGIAKTILYQEKGFNGEGNPIDEVQGTDLPYGSRMLKVVCDYIKLESAGYTIPDAIEQLDSQKQRYDPSILSAFKSTLDFEPPKVFVDVSFLNPNMIIEQEIRTNRDQLIARKGQRVTQTLMNIVHHCLENKAVTGEVWVTMIEPEEHEQTESEEKAQSF